MKTSPPSLPDVEDLDDRRMPEPGGAPGLDDEPLAAPPGSSSAQQLHRDGPFELEVDSPVDDAHPPLADGVRDLVSARERLHVRPRVR